METYLEVGSYLPHTSPMILLDKVLYVDESSAICSLKITKDGNISRFFNKDFQLKSFFAIEIISEVIGVFASYNSFKIHNEGVKLGMLIGIRTMDFKIPYFNVGDELEIKVNLITKDDHFGSFDGQIYLKNECIVQGRVNTYQATDNQEFLALLHKENQ